MSLGLRACSALSLTICLGALAASPQPEVYVNGLLKTSGPLGFDETFGLQCRGVPTCQGFYKSFVRFDACSNFVTFSGRLTITGMNLSQSGPIAGTFTLEPGKWSATRQPDGTCTAVPLDPTETIGYAGTWDRDRGSGRGTLAGRTADFTFRADLAARPAVFPIVPRANLGPVLSTATVDLEFRAQDIGKTRGIYVFATAPAARARGGLAAGAMPLGKADASGCVIAQLDGSGSLVAVQNGQMQAAANGVLSAQGATVSVMNNVATNSVAGATFYVGYGESGAAMLDEGVFRNAVLVPGSSTCPPLPYVTSLWWNPAESGWGLNLDQQGNTAFGTLFTYDANRSPSWFVMSAGALQSDGVTFSGDLYRTTGPAFNANPFTPIGPANLARVGTMSVELVHADEATLTYTVDGTTVAKSIQRQVFGAQAANCMPSAATARASSTNYQDLWWNAAESGWGLNVTHQGDTLFATLFTYDASGRDLWLVMSAGAKQPDGSYAGDLYRTSGPAFSAVPFTPVGASDVTKVGAMTLRFTDGDHGTLTYTYSGATVTKAITRQVFSAPVSACR